MYNSLPKYAYKNPIGITRAGMQVMGAPSNASEITEEEYEKGKEAVMKFSTGSLILLGVVAFAIYKSDKKRK